MNVKIKRALISVSDKTGANDFAQQLYARNIEILSTGGSAKHLSEQNVPIVQISQYTNTPEMMGGRVKTLHPKIHGGLLIDRDNPEHINDMNEHNILPIDLLIVNLYPFEKTTQASTDFITCIENIDIGGPAMIRSAAKNHNHVLVIVDPNDYNHVIKEIDSNNGSTTLEFRRQMATKAFARTGAYDAEISQWLAQNSNDMFPDYIAVGGKLKYKLRYGENPHQSAAFYTSNDGKPSIGSAKQLQGKELSFNNLNDTDAAFDLVSEFAETPACAVIKHANPSGVATGKTLAEAYDKALQSDPLSAYGGIVAFNKTLNAETASKFLTAYTEVIIAPAISDEAQKILNQKSDIRLLVTGGIPNVNRTGILTKTVSGGMLVQTRDNLQTSLPIKVVTHRTPSDKEMQDMVFAFTVCKHVKSNAIVYAKNCATIGIGAGQMSRVDSCKIAAWKADEVAKTSKSVEQPTLGAVVASDAFFPFADGILAVKEAGATAIIQPGGSIRDKEIIDVANENSLAMVFTDTRHFKH